MNVNGEVQRIECDPRTSLLDALREHMDLTGTKKGCNQGACGACTVLIDGRRVNACLTLAIMHIGAEVTTIEGLAKGDELHPLQAAFIDRRAAMRLLHPGPDHVRRWLHQRGPRALRRRDPGMDERQHLPLRRLPRGCRGHRPSGRGVLTMFPFIFEKVRTEDEALQAAAAGGRFLAGGTTLIDLMREEVEQPGHLVDINALPWPVSSRKAAIF